MADITGSIVHVNEAIVRKAHVSGAKSATANVAVPTLTSGASGAVNVTVTGVKRGDVVLAAPKAALPTNAVLTNAYVSNTDTVTLVFAATGAVTGASVSHDIVVLTRA